MASWSRITRGMFNFIYKKPAKITTATNTSALIWGRITETTLFHFYKFCSGTAYLVEGKLLN